MAILSYLGILLLIPLATGAHKNSPFAKFHLNQGLILAIVMIGWGIVYTVLLAIFSAVLLSSYTYSGIVTYGIISTIIGLLWFVPAILCIIGLVNAGTGKFKQLPIIGKFTILK